jgi:hypothetical protein
MLTKGGNLDVWAQLRGMLLVITGSRFDYVISAGDQSFTSSSVLVNKLYGTCKVTHSLTLRHSEVGKGLTAARSAQDVDNCCLQHRHGI